MCISSCPYKKVFYNWATGKAEKCLMCYPRVESGMPPNCAESCVGRIRYVGVVLYDADRILDAASADREEDLYQAQLDVFLDPNDPEVEARAREDGIPENWLEAARRSPVWKMAMDWKIAFPLHPEFRTLPMMWYVPPLSPVQSQLDQGSLATEADGVIPKAEALRLPVRYLANLLTAGDTGPVLSALNRLIAMRSYQRSLRVSGEGDLAVLERVGLTEEQVTTMYRYLAIANYEDRFVIPTGQDELRQDDAYAFQGSNGFSAGNCSVGGGSAFSVFSEPSRETEHTMVFVPPPGPGKP